MAYYFSKALPLVLFLTCKLAGGGHSHLQKNITFVISSDSGGRVLTSLVLWLCYLTGEELHVQKGLKTVIMQIRKVSICIFKDAPISQQRKSIWSEVVWQSNGKLETIKSYQCP